MRIIVAPSYGNPKARRNFAKTLTRKVDFTLHRSLLTAEEQDQLDQLHPEGWANFWGATEAQDSKFPRMKKGDIVLFTGQKMVRGIGEVGATFQNSDFADQLRPRDPKLGSWHNVYSVQDFISVEIPYAPLHEALRAKPGDNFQGLRVVDDEEKFAAVVETFALDSQSQFDGDVDAAKKLAESLGSTEIVPPEANNTSGSTYTRAAGEIIFKRAESALVEDYSSQLPDDADVKRLRIDGQLTDLYIRTGDEAELVEAKSRSSNFYVRQALAQALDYAANTSEGVTRLSGLFPGRPMDRDIRLLHLFGIDCIYRTSDGQYARKEAPEESKESWRSARREQGFGTP